MYQIYHIILEFTPSTALFQESEEWGWRRAVEGVNSSMI
jgi:hypothetical protein